MIALDVSNDRGKNSQSVSIPLVFRSTLILFLIAALMPVALGNEKHFDYAFFGGDRGGVARLVVNLEEGKIISQTEIFTTPNKPVVHELVQTPCRQFLAMTDRSNEGRSIFVMKRSGSGLEGSEVTLPERGMRLVAGADRIGVLGNRGSFFTLTVDPPAVEKTIELRNLPRPGVGALEAPTLSPDRTKLVILAREGDLSGRRVGGRVIITTWPDLEGLIDIEIPPLKADLHYKGESKEDNPVPTRILLHEETKTAAILLELYGAVFFTDLDALWEGQFRNHSLVSVSKDGSFGTAFPTLLELFSLNDEPMLAVDNGTTSGGLAFLSLRKRELITWVDSGPTNIAFWNVLADGQRAVANRGGEVANRGSNATERAHTEQNDLILMDLAPLAEGNRPGFEVISFDDHLYFSEPLGDDAGRYVLLGFFGSRDQKLTLAIYDTVTREMTDRQETLGVIRGLVF